MTGLSETLRASQRSRAGTRRGLKCRVTQHVLKDAAGPPNTLEQYDYDYSPGGLPSNTYGYQRAETTTGDTYLIAFDRLNPITPKRTFLVPAVPRTRGIPRTSG